jgi:hypothetical protein
MLGVLAAVALSGGAGSPKRWFTAGIHPRDSSTKSDADDNRKQPFGKSLFEFLL